MRRFLIILGVATACAAAFVSGGVADPSTQGMTGGGEAAAIEFAFGASGNATGVHGHYRFGGVSGAVTCLVVVGNVGVLGGPEEGSPGGYGFVTAMDGGDGNPDTIQFISGPVPADQVGCAATLALFPPLGLVTRGNVTIHD